MSDARDVVFHGLCRDEQLRTDGLVGASFGNEASDVGLSFRQTGADESIGCRYRVRDEEPGSLQ